MVLQRSLNVILGSTFWLGSTVDRCGNLPVQLLRGSVGLASSGL